MVENLKIPGIQPIYPVPTLPVHEKAFCFHHGYQKALIWDIWIFNDESSFIKIFYNFFYKFFAAIISHNSKLYISFTKNSMCCVILMPHLSLIYYFALNVSILGNSN